MRHTTHISTILLIFMLLLGVQSLYAQRGEGARVGNVAERDESLQSAGQVTSSDYQYAVGDTVIISKSQDTYLSGEKISDWVYYVRHVIQQVGGKRFPDGVLLAGINSWVKVEGDILLMGAVNKSNTALARQEQDRAQIVERLLELDSFDEEKKEALQASAQQHNMYVMFDAAREQALRDSMAAAERLHAIRLQALRDSLTEVIRERLQQESAMRDSLLSQHAQREQALLDREQALRDSALLAEQALRYSQLTEQALRDSLQSEQAQRDLLLAEKARRDKLEAERARQDSLRAAQAEQARLDSLHASKAKSDSIAACNKPTQFNRLGAGLRGGVASMMQKTLPEANGAWKIGFDVLADVQYAHYWRPKDGVLTIGVLTGLSVGYARGGVTAKGDREYDITDEDKEEVHYTITNANATEQDGSVVIEIPAMLSMIIKDHFFINVGPRFAIPVFSHYSQELTQPSIDYYNKTRGVHVVDQLITGKVDPSMLKQGGATKLSQMNLQLSLEGGYELELPMGHALGIGAYFNYSVFSLYPNDPTGKSLINIGAPSSTEGSETALVTISPITEAFVQRNGLGFFDCGIKLIYHFMKW